MAELNEMDVLVVGSLHLDIVVQARALPAIDETARGTSWKMVCGGKGGNQASWAARLGAGTAMISRIGDDDFGRRLLANLKAFNVDTRGISLDTKTGSGMSVAIVQDDGEYGAVIVSGSNLTLTETDVKSALAALGKPRILVLQNEIAEEINLLAAGMARDLGARVLLNAAPARALPSQLAELVDILVVNRVEAEMMSGRPVADVQGAFDALPKLQEAAASVVITLGGLGLVAAAAGQQPRHIAAEKIKVVSAHGAGDCFIGQLAQALAQGEPLEEACQRASKTAALFVGGKLEQ